MTIGIGYDPYSSYQSYAGNGAFSDRGVYAQNSSAVRPEDAGKLRLLGQEDAEKTPAEKADPDEHKKAGRKSSPADCETCKSRKYKDGSDEANVSFKAASHISPQAAGTAVRAHENEHVSNAYKKAAKDNGEVLSATVSIHTAICPECGRSYISGGTTNTMIKYKNEDNPYQKELKAADATRLRGAHLDLIA